MAKNMKKDGRRWANIAQIQWILSWLPEYLEAQRTNTFHLFWPKLFKAWFLEFPCRDPTAADLSEDEDEQDSGTDVPPESADEHEVQADQRKKQKKAYKKKAQAKKKALTTSLSSHDKKKGRLIHKQQEQLKTFLRWHCPSSRSSRKKADGATCACQLFEDGTANKPFRRLQETEAYIKLYYESRMLEPLRKRVAEPGSPHLINVIREVARDMWAADKEDEDTRDAVSAYIEKHAQEHLQEIAKAAKALEAVAPTPEQYQEAITALPAYLEGVLRQVTRRTGFSLTVIMGGPVPMDNGTIHTASISTGKNPLTTATFKESYEAFDAAVLRPYNDFLRHVYSSDVRASRSLTSGLSQINIAAQQPSNHNDGTHTQSAPHTADLGVNDTPPAGNANTVPASDDHRNPPTARIAERAAGSDGDHDASSTPYTNIAPSLSPRLHRAATSPVKARPKPPGFTSQKVLEERAAQQAAVQQAAAQQAASQEAASQQAAAQQAASQQAAAQQAAAQQAASQQAAAQQAAAQQAASQQAAAQQAASQQAAAQQAQQARPKPTPPGFASRKVLEERAAQEAAAQQAAAQQAQQVAVATSIAQTAAGIGGAGEAFSGPSTPTPDAPTISNARSPRSFMTALDALMTDVEDRQPRGRRKITVTVAGAALAAEKEVNTARAMKAAQTKAMKAMKRGAGENLEEGPVKKKKRASKAVERAGENLEEGTVKKKTASKPSARKKKHAP